MYTHTHVHTFCLAEDSMRAEAPSSGAWRSRLVLTAVSITSPCYYPFSTRGSRGLVKLSGPCSVTSVVVTGFEPRHARDPPFLSLLPCPKQPHVHNYCISHSGYPAILPPKLSWQPCPAPSSLPWSSRLSFTGHPEPDLLLESSSSSQSTQKKFQSPSRTLPPSLWLPYNLHL